MRYRHFTRFQFILQDALRSAAKQPIINSEGTEVFLTDPQYLAYLGLDGPDKPKWSAKKLSEFRHFTFPDYPEKWPLDESPYDINSPLKDRRVAVRLWMNMNERGFIGHAIKKFPRVLQTKNVFGPDETASTVSSFYGVHDSQIERLGEQGFCRDGGSEEWFCYKPSYLQLGYVVKSLVRFDPKSDHYDVREEQISTTLDGEDTKRIEVSNGFGFAKSFNLWLMLREEDTEQPRVFCFYDLVDTHEHHGVGLKGQMGWHEKAIVALRGQMIESVRKSKGNGCYNYPVVLTSVDYEAWLWEKRRASGPFDVKQQINMHRLDNGKHKSDSAFFIPDLVRAHLVPYVEP